MTLNGNALMRATICLLLLPAFSYRSLAQDKEEKAVSDAVETLRQKMVDPDKASLERLAADDLSYGHSNGLIQTKAEFVEALTSGKSDFVSIELSQQTVKIVGNNAIVRHILAGVTNDGGKPGTTRLSVLMVWQKQKGEWKLLARQATKVPVP
ncbi:MAG TPA: nuclear transport factor 2 family protein [Puia sp.]|nr:nuclear transport factor 2 family protein [Puia sp.]